MSTNGRMGTKKWFIHTAECFPDLKKTLPFEGKYMQPDMIILCEYFMIKSENEKWSRFLSL